MKKNRTTLSKLFYSITTLLFILSTAYAQEVPIPLIRTLEGYYSAVNCVAFSPDGKVLASGSDDQTIKLWDVQTGRTLQTLMGHSGNVFSVAFSPDGKVLASGSGDRTIKLWDVQTGGALQTLTGHSSYVFSVAFSPDGKILASGSSDGTIKLWDVQIGRALQILTGHSNVRSVAFSPDGKILASGSSDGTIKLWDVQTGGALQTLTGHSSFVYSVDFSPDGKVLASGSYDEPIKLWDVQTGRALQTLTGHSGNVSSMAFSPDGKLMASGSWDNKPIKLWDVQTGRALQTLKGHSSGVTSVAFSPDGKVLASGNDDNTIRLWDVSFLLQAQAKSVELQSIVPLFKPKDEFETETEYRTRITKANAEKKAIEEKYALKFAQLTRELEARKRIELQEKELVTQTKIRESITEATLTISNVGTFNADTETFPITINGVTQNIKIPRAEARSFKENWQTAEVRGMKQLKTDLTTYEYFNLEIVHPVTGNRYPFGEQRDIGQLAANNPTTTSGTSRSVVPPALSIKAKLVEPSGNGFLDAEERGKIIIDIVNSGKGSAYGIIVDVKNETVDPNVTFSRTRVAGEIPPGLTKTVEFEVEAAKVVKRAFQNFVVSATESNGFLPNPVKLNFETYPLPLPELSLVDYGITTVSGDNIISPGEVVNIRARVQNIGEGKAKNINFAVNLPTNVFFAPESEQRFQALELNSGAFQDLEFSILTNNKVEKQVNLAIGMTEANTQKSFILPLEIDKPLQSLQEFVVKGKEREKTVIENVATLTVDIAKDIPITPIKNLEAYAVVIGNRDYLKVKNVDFAINDATLVKEYLIKTFGYRDENIFFIKNATKADFELCFGTKGNYKGKLSNAIRPDGSSDVFVFYSGHGSPDVNDQKGYFVPVDADPQYVGVSGYALDLLYENLAQIPAKSVTVVLDACFSGSGLLENISPVRIKFTNALMAIRNGVVLSSSTGDQVSGWYPEKRHGLFTYFFLKAMHNRNADFNKDGLLTFEEIFNYVADANEGVPRYARKLHNVEQNPTMMGDKSWVFVKY